MSPVGAARAGSLVGVSADALQHIETQEPSGVSSADFTNVFGSSDGYDRYVAFVDNFIPANDDTSLFVRFSTDGGSNWDSGSSDYAWSYFSVEEDGSTNTQGSGGASELDNIVRRTGNDPSGNETGGASFVISDPTNSNRATVLRNGHIRYNNVFADPLRTAITGGIRLTQSAVDSIQFSPDSGNISSGIISVYGVAQ